MSLGTALHSGVFQSRPPHLTIPCDRPVRQSDYLIFLDFSALDLGIGCAPVPRSFVTGGPLRSVESFLNTGRPWQVTCFFVAFFLAGAREP